MSKITVWFIRFAIIYFLVAILLGLYMSTAGAVYPWMPIHTHFNLLGWMSMMIYGVAYHILPRFSGKQLWSDPLAYAQLWMANIGLLGMAAGWVLMSSSGSTVLLVFSLVEALSVVFFAMNMLLTVKAAPPPKPAPAAKK